MELSSSSYSSSSQPIIPNKGENKSTVESISSHSDPTVGVPLSNPCSNPNQTSKSISNGGRVIKKKIKRVSKAFSASSSSSTTQQQRGMRIVGKSKNAKVTVNGNDIHRLYGDTAFDSLALPLGMSIAAFVAQWGDVFELWFLGKV